MDRVGRYDCLLDTLQASAGPSRSPGPRDVSVSQSATAAGRLGALLPRRTRRHPRAISCETEDVLCHPDVTRVLDGERKGGGGCNFDGDYIWIYKTGVVLWIIFGLGYLAMILNYISRAMRCKQIRRVEDRLSASFHSTQHKFGQRLDEIHRLLQEFASKQKSHRKSIWRGKSGDKRLTDSGGGGADDDVSADSLCGGSDKNHNTREDQIQRLLTLVETLKEESTQNLCRTRQLIETHNLRLQLEAPYHLREELLPPRAEGGLPRGEAAPSRRHSLPVLHTDAGLLGTGTGGATESGFLAVAKDYLHVKNSGGHKNRSHLEFPTNFFAPRASIPLCNGRLSHRDSYDA
ncbi:hypothetical protein HPB51_007122 [Rhipicephalus microplus]|uniref:Uncharacterized protein n=1 Tax=Rhipicephalus microplus TaxID=6941 RepID=A0A9J6DZU9_RHIMP|nr:hypothetical protein HPB51_007122 [Rhipicephalus microplus]